MHTANLTFNGGQGPQIKKRKKVQTLPEQILYSLLDYIQAGWSYSDIVRANLCPKENRPALKAFINSYIYAT